MSEEYKVSIPLFEPNELVTFDNHIHEIIEEYSKMMFKEKDQILTQRIIMKQEQEIERLNNIINELEKDLEEKIDEDRLNILSNSHWKYVLDRIKELKGSDK